MGELGAIEEDVRFDWAGAEQLSAELRSTAALLDDQVPRRNAVAESARTEWRGAFSEQFVDRMRICTSDAQRFAEVMRTAATDLDALADMARQEQARRERGREWEAEQRSEGGVEKFVEGLFGTDEQPFSEPIIYPPNVRIDNPAASNRGG